MKKRDYKTIADVAVDDDIVGEIGIEVLECSGPAFENEDAVSDVERIIDERVGTDGREHPVS